MARLAAAAALAACCGAAQAGELEFGLGLDDVLGHNGSSTAAVLVQIRSDPRATLGPVGLSVAAAAEADTRRDLWAGAGIVGLLPLRGGFRIDGSVMAGIYAVGDGGNELGSELEFRSRLGVSRAVRKSWRVGFAIEHKSNGGVGDLNPGVETVFVTLARQF
jgi:hypothetical protein